MLDDEGLMMGVLGVWSAALEISTAPPSLSHSQKTKPTPPSRDRVRGTKQLPAAGLGCWVRVHGSEKGGFELRGGGGRGGRVGREGREGGKGREGKEEWGGRQGRVGRPLHNLFLFFLHFLAFFLIRKELGLV